MTALPRFTRLSALAATLLAVAAACGGRTSTASTAPTPVRASAGDTIYVIEHFVRPDRRAQFERFIRDSYWPAVRQVAQTDARMGSVLRQTRVLYPARANEDGTFTYLFVMDPVVSGETYNILDLLRRVYSPAETERRYRELTESWARQFQASQSRPYVQSQYPTAP